MDNFITENIKIIKKYFIIMCVISLGLLLIFGEGAFKEKLVLCGVLIFCYFFTYFGAQGILVLQIKINIAPKKVTILFANIFFIGSLLEVISSLINFLSTRNMDIQCAFMVSASLGVLCGVFKFKAKYNTNKSNNNSIKSA